MKKLLMHWLNAGLLLLLVIFGGPVCSEEYIIERAYFEDKTAQLGLNEARMKEFSSYKGLLTRGFSNSAYWIRLKVRPTTSDKPLVLRVQPSYLDDVQIYQSIDGNFQRKVIGDKHAYTDRDYPQTSFGVAVLPTAREHYIYARLQTSSTNMIHFELTDEKLFINAEGKRDVILGMLMGSILLILVLSVFQSVHYTEKLFLLFSVFLAIEFLFIGSITGYLSRYFFPANPVLVDSITNFVILGFVSAAALFHRQFVVSEVSIQWIAQALNIFWVLHSFLFILLFAGYSKIVLQLNVIMLLFLVAITLTIPVIYAFNQSRVVPGIALNYLLTGLIAIVTILPLIANMNSPIIMLYSNLFNGLVTSSIIFFLLKTRQTHKNAVVSQARHELIFERQRREMQSRFMAMLAHQIKTPLSVIKLAFDNVLSTHRWKSHTNRAVRDIELIIDRCLQLDKLERNAQELKNTVFDPVSVIRQEIDKIPQPERVRLTVGNDIKLKTDKYLFSIIINNVLENAYKYSLPESEIDVIVASRKRDYASEWIVTVTNEVGVFGFPDADRLFEKYYRSPRAEKISGSGLGLFLVKTLLDMLNGRIRYSANTNYVTFEICLPN